MVERAGSAESRPVREFLSRTFLVAGGLAIVLACALATFTRSAFEPDAFAERAAESLAEPGVAAFVADRITSGVLAQSPDLVAVRPLIVATARTIVGSEPFRNLVRTGARSAHQAAFSEGGRRIVLAVPDVGVLLNAALEQGNPQLVERIPDQVRTIVASVESAEVGERVARIWNLREGLEWVEWLSALLAPLLLLLGAWLSVDRYAGFFRVGAGVLGAGLLLWALFPTGGYLAGAWFDDPLTHDFVWGLWRGFMGGLRTWGLFFCGLGGLFLAAGSSLLESFAPKEWIERAWRAVATPPPSRTGRAAWGTGLVALGTLSFAAPEPALRVTILSAALAVGVLGARELFRLALESVEAAPRVSRATDRGRSRLRLTIVVTLVAALGGAWFALRHPADPPDPRFVTRCNTSAQLCDRPLDRVAFAGSHNAMSSAAISDWMFPHHQRDIPGQLWGGVRALLVDVHYGFPGGARIKTDLGGNRPTQDVLDKAIGVEGREAAERIRDTLVGVNEAQHGLYLCHGLCELGAYELTPVLREIHDLMIQHPGAVVLLIVEDYVLPQDLALAFEDSRLGELVYRGPSGPPWPTLRELIASRQPVIVFLESGAPGVDWLRPAFELIQETPYTFRTQEEFSCRPNRGSPDASLFMINHWIESTPTPLPSNADLVNAYDVLRARVRRCEQERGRFPNIVAVDFVGSGDLLRVVDELNGLER